LVQEKSTGIALDSDSVEALNTVLEGCDLVSCMVDPDSRLAVATVNVFGILPEDGRLEEEYPLCLAVYPVGRVAASHVVDGEVQPLDLESINQVLSGFSSRDIEDWDLIDPPASLRFKWRDKVGLDVQLGDDQKHLMELWQDDGPIQLFNIGLWFDRLYLFDLKLRSVSLDMLAEWRQRLKVAMDESVGPGGGWSRSIPAPSPPVRLSSVLELIDRALWDSRIGRREASEAMATIRPGPLVRKGGPGRRSVVGG
jgi:hypothetical protein